MNSCRSEEGLFGQVSCNMGFRLGSQARGLVRSAITSN